MDAVLVPLGGGLTALAVLAAVIGSLLRQNAADRRDQRAALAAARTEYQTALVAAEARTKQMADRATVAQLGEDEARAGRQRAEDNLAVALRELAGIRAEVARQGHAITSTILEQR